MIQLKQNSNQKGHPDMLTQHTAESEILMREPNLEYLV
jgi:hypothetical protein